MGRARRKVVPSSSMPSATPIYLGTDRYWRGLHRHGHMPKPRPLPHYVKLNRDHVLPWLWQVQAEHRWSNEQLARRLDVTTSRISAWRNGRSKPTRLTLRVLAAFAIAHMSRRRTRWLDQAMPRLA